MGIIFDPDVTAKLVGLIPKLYGLLLSVQNGSREEGHDSDQYHWIIYDLGGTDAHARNCIRDRQAVEIPDRELFLAALAELLEGCRVLEESVRGYE